MRFSQIEVYEYRMELLKKFGETFEAKANRFSNLEKADAQQIYMNWTDKFIANKEGDTTPYIQELLFQWHFAQIANFFNSNREEMEHLKFIYNS